MLLFVFNNLLNYRIEFYINMTVFELGLYVLVVSNHILNTFYSRLKDISIYCKAIWFNWNFAIVFLWEKIHGCTKAIGGNLMAGIVKLKDII